jgi:hypothetical protein
MVTIEGTLAEEVTPRGPIAVAATIKGTGGSGLCMTVE